MTADELIKHFEGVKQSVIGRVPDIIQTAGVRVQADAKRDAPIEFGRLRNSITAQAEDDRFTAVVYTDVEYAPYQEFGTNRMGAQPYLMPAFDRHAPKVVQAIDKLIKDSL